ncbi:hypothetical protein QN397_24635 [Variovorax sp. RTB1]|uniref:hypothetical protein n=1 Tax=Variovorax sp. RTB1 TaxID=3048631 RepID=UPI002B2314F7|nr:hypothetical protein [Variovorax sp. RTB1]MEB0114472.1 hypothetical protein [Variovorax sp. RTB1]
MAINPGNFPFNPLDHFFYPPAQPIDPPAGDFLFDLYSLLRNAPPTIGPWPRQRTFEAAADALYPWRIVAISIDAIRHVANLQGAAGLRRAHAVSRNQRYLSIFGQEAQPLTRAELLNFFFQNDTCALVTTVENATDGFAHWSNLFSVAPPYFQAAAGRFRAPVRLGLEVPWAVNMLLRINSGDVLPGWVADAQ